MSRCEQMQERISRMLDGELSPEEQAEVREHIAGCAECAALYEAFSAVSDAIGQDLEEAPESLHENVMAEIRREEIRRRNQARRPWRAILTTAACLAL
ncbi:MAG: zf-HC2 domain-containing protein, partial [Oscillospiraceae bacterium]|nr:zf-HC2 domain-containing protein [Oscillospiraceae bacterium]